MYLVLGAVYFLVAMGIFKLVEGWDPSETSVFLLSILTGCGYGHIIPSTKLGLVRLGAPGGLAGVARGRVAGHIRGRSRSRQGAARSLERGGSGAAIRGGRRRARLLRALRVCWHFTFTTSFYRTCIALVCTRLALHWYSAGTTPVRHWYDIGIALARHWH